MSSSKFNPDATELNVMPKGVMKVMLGYLDCEDKDAEVSTGPLVSTLFNSLEARRLRNFRALLTAAVSGKPDEAKALLDKDASLGFEQLLEEKEIVVSRTNHLFRMSPYQAALAVKDMQMAALIKSYCKDEKEADRQNDKQRLDKVEDAKKWQAIFKQRDKLLRTIRDRKEDIMSSGAPHYIATEKKDTPVAKELAEFYKLLDATLEDVITPGKRPFNSDLYSEALQLYDNDETYKEYFGGRWDDPRALFFIQKVAGYEGMQRYLSVDTIQAHQEWLMDTVKKLETGVPQARGTELKVYRPDGTLEKTVDVYPVRPRGTAGFNFMIYAHGAGVHGVAARAGGWPFRSLCQSKTAAEQNLCRNTKTIDLSQQGRLV